VADSVRKPNICSIRYQSKVRSFWYDVVVNKNRFSEVSNETQKKNIIEFTKE
jgi:hypothetical protein